MLQILVLLCCVIIAPDVWAACNQAGAAEMGVNVFGELMAGGSGYPKAFTTAYKFIDDCWRQTKPEPASVYDITINGNWHFLRELGKDGWTVQVAKDLHEECNQIEDTDERSACFQQAVNIQGCYVSWTGGFNNGKTTILNKVTKKNFDTGYSKSGETKGLNFILKRDSKGRVKKSGVIHIDTPGATRAVEPEMLQDRFMTDKFVYDVLPDISDIVVLVVDILTSNEQVLIQQLMDKIISFSTGDRQRRLIVVHNFKTLSTVADVQEYIQTDVMEAFEDAEEIEKDWNGEEKVAFYTSRYKQKYQMTHFVFAQEHTDAGSEYNEIAAHYLRQFTNDMMCTSLNMNVLDHFIHRLEPLLREYFHALEVNQAHIVKPPFNPYDTLVRAARWINGVWGYDDRVQKKELLEINVDELGHDPFKLIFKPVVGHEDYDGVIVLKNSHPLEYCGSDGIGKTPQCRPKVNCVVWNKQDLWSLQCTVPNGDFTDSNSDFNEAVKTKFFLLKNVCELIIYGTVLPLWSPYIKEQADIDAFRLIHSDAVLHGWIEKRFKMQDAVCVAYNDHARSSQLFESKNGVLTVNVPLTASAAAQLPLKQEV